MDTKQFEDAVARLGEMLEVYGRIDTLPPLLQDAVKESLLRRFEYTQETVSYTHLTLPTNREV